MKRFMMLALLAGAVTAIPLARDNAAHAQPAGAIGKPLPDGTLPVGTVSVRVVAGAPSSPVIGVEVTLLVNNAPRTARTDSAGRAMFAGLPPGANVQAKALDAESKDTKSEEFQVPAEGGVRVMLTTKPFAGGAMGGGMPPGMPEARQMSGQPRPDRGVEPGSYQVRVTYNNLQIDGGEAKDSDPPVGESVTLVGYSFDESVAVHVKKVEKDGHVTFDGLDVSGNIVYFALTRLPRNGAFDRLASQPEQLGTQAGSKLVLSSDKRTSTVPVIDELATPDAPAAPAGKVKITLEGYPREASEVTLIDAVTKQVVAKGIPAIAPPDPSKVEGGAQFEADKSLPPGTLDIIVHGGGGQDAPLAGIAVKVVPATSTNIAEGLASKTGADGTVRMAVTPNVKQRVLFTVNGKELASNEIDLSASGGKLDVMARWESEGKPQVTFDVPYNPQLVLYAETRQMGIMSHKIELYRSMPFQLLEGTGAAVAISVLPRVLFSFQLQSFVEDDIFAVRGLWRVMNNSWVPYKDTADGLLIRLPKHHVGAVVGDEWQGLVSPAQGEGFRILRALPPGATQFDGGFSIYTEDGRVDWHFDLPLGAFQSALQIRHFPGLHVDLPEGVKGEIQTGRSGTPWFTIDDIMIPTNKSMELTISGLPSQPKWKKWVPRVVGIMVVIIMIAGVAFAMVRKREAPTGGDAKKRQELMDELVDLEKKGIDPKRRDQVLAELERIWE